MGRGALRRKKGERGKRHGRCIELPALHTMAIKDCQVYSQQCCGNNHMGHCAQSNRFAKAIVAHDKSRPQPSSARISVHGHSLGKDQKNRRLGPCQPLVGLPNPIPAKYTRTLPNSDVTQQRQGRRTHRCHQQCSLLFQRSEIKPCSFLVSKIRNQTLRTTRNFKFAKTSEKDGWNRRGKLSKLQAWI